jgi:hypothetical protein
MFDFIQTTCGGIKLFILIQLLQFRKYCIIHKKKHTPTIKMNTIWKEYYLTIRKWKLYIYIKSSKHTKENDEPNILVKLSPNTNQRKIQDEHLCLTYTKTYERKHLRQTIVEMHSQSVAKYMYNCIHAAATKQETRRELSVTSKMYHWSIILLLCLS